MINFKDLEKKIESDGNTKKKVKKKTKKIAVHPVSKLLDEEAKILLKSFHDLTDKDKETLKKTLVSMETITYYKQIYNLMFKSVFLNEILTVQELNTLPKLHELLQTKLTKSIKKKSEIKALYKQTE